jgi:flagellar basal body-associated protein FliL
MKTDVKPWLGALTFIGFIACLLLLFYVPPPSGTRDIILIVIGTLVVLVKDVYGFYFGSSEGSARKTELMSGADLPIAPALIQGTTSIPPTSSVKEGGFARLSILVILAILVTAFITGCATTETPQSTAAKSLLGTRQGIIAVATTADELCTQGVMKQADCDTAAKVYTQAQVAYNLASDAFLVYLDTGQPGGFEAVMSRLRTLLLDMQKLTGAASSAPTGGK